MSRSETLRSASPAVESLTGISQSGLDGDGSQAHQRSGREAAEQEERDLDDSVAADEDLGERLRLRRITCSSTAKTCCAPGSSVAAVAFSKNLAAGLSTARRVGSNPSAALNEVAVTLAPTSKLAVNGSNGTSDSLVSVVDDERRQ